MGRPRNIAAAIFVFGLIVGWVVGPAHCKVKVQLHYMPPGVDYQIPGGDRVRYFTLDMYKKLLQMDHELWVASQQIETLSKMYSNFTEMLKQKDLLIDSKNKEIKIYAGRADRVTKLWYKSEEALAKERDKFSWSSFGLGLGIGAGAAAIAISAVVIAVSTSK